MHYPQIQPAARAMALATPGDYSLWRGTMSKASGRLGCSTSSCFAPPALIQTSAFNLAMILRVFGANAAMV